MTGVILKVASAPISRLAKKQERKTVSTCDTESLATISACHHVQHMRDLLAEFDVIQKWPTPLYNDNTAAVSLSEEARAHHRSIHLTRQMAAVRELTHDGVIAPHHVPTLDMEADLLTKRVNRQVFLRCRVLSGLCPLPKGVTLGQSHLAAAQGGVLDPVAPQPQES